jgi:hypothetical protein
VLLDDADDVELQSLAIEASGNYVYWRGSGGVRGADLE